MYRISQALVAVAGISARGFAVAWFRGRSSLESFSPAFGKGVVFRRATKCTGTRNTGYPPPPRHCHRNNISNATRVAFQELWYRPIDFCRSATWTRVDSSKNRRNGPGRRCLCFVFFEKRCPRSLELRPSGGFPSPTPFCARHLACT